MKQADITIGDEYAYKRSGYHWAKASRVTVHGTGLGGHFYKWCRQDDFRLDRVRKRAGLPKDALVFVEDENANILIGADGHLRGINNPGYAYLLVNSRYIVSTWAEEEERQAEEAEAERRAAIRREQARAEQLRKEEESRRKRGQWTAEFPAVRDAFAAAGIEVVQGIDGIHLSPEQAKQVAAALAAR